MENTIVSSQVRDCSKVFFCLSSMEAKAFFFTLFFSLSEIIGIQALCEENAAISLEEEGGQTVPRGGQSKTCVGFCVWLKRRGGQRLEEERLAKEKEAAVLKKQQIEDADGERGKEREGK